MSDHVPSHDSAESRSTDQEEIETVETYETDGGVVLYDAENPLGWVESDRAVALADLR